MTFYAPDKNRSLSIEEPPNFAEGTPKNSQDLLRTVMLAHLIARHFPKTIETNFKVEETNFLNELYKHYGLAKPRVIKNPEQIVAQYVESDSKKDEIRFANAHSGGLDSIYRVAKLLSENQKVLIAHVRNLNPKGMSAEAVASKNQANNFGLPYEEIRLKSSSDNLGFSMMKTRDMFLALIAAMAAEPYGAKKVFIEGDMQTSPSAHFSEYGPAWDFFNRLIRESGLHSQIEGMDAHDIETIGEVLKFEKILGVEILPLVQNCFCAPFQLPNSRRKWERETPQIAKNSSDHWCGSCIKCRRMTLGRLFYHDKNFSKVSKKETLFFIEDTYKWLRDYPHNKALITESFMSHLDSLRGQDI